jgi:hypothetical protein
MRLPLRRRAGPGHTPCDRALPPEEVQHSALGAGLAAACGLKLQPNAPTSDCCNRRARAVRPRRPGAAALVRRQSSEPAIASTGTLASSLLSHRRHCDRPDSAPHGPHRAFGFAQQRASGYRGADDSFRPPAGAESAIALATLRSSESSPIGAPSRFRVRPGACAGGCQLARLLCDASMRQHLRAHTAPRPSVGGWSAIWR